MPLYIALVVDGMNNSVPVAFCLVANETKEIVDYFIKCFVEHNTGASSVQSFMTDKDFTEIEVLSQYFPSASHELCLFHVLKNFKTLVQNSDVPRSQSDEAKRLLEAMVYSYELSSFMEKFEDFKAKFSKYNLFDDFMRRWYLIKESWSMFSRVRTFNLGDTTNNRLESFNQKLKLLIKRYSPLDVFYRDLKLCLNNMWDRLYFLSFNQRFKLDKIVSSVPGEVVSQFSSVATSFVCNRTVNELSEGLSASSINHLDSEKFSVKINGHRDSISTSKSCNCSLFMMRRLPCCHIFSVRNYLGLDLFDESLIPIRWQRVYYNETLEKSTSIKGIGSVRVEKVKKVSSVLSEGEKYSKARDVCNRLVEVLKTSGTDVFEERLEILKKLGIEWSVNKDTSKKKSEDFSSLGNIDEEGSDISGDLKNDVYEGVGMIEAEFPVAVKVRGRPKGTVTTAIGRKRVLSKPSERKRKFKSLNVMQLEDWVEICSEVPLKLSHEEILLGNDWLDSSLVYAGMCMLRRDFPDIEGLQRATLSMFSPPSFVPCSGFFVQICHVNGNHWNLVSGSVENGILVINVFDSLFNDVHQDNVSIVSSLNRKSTEISKVEVRFHDVVKQKNGSDCGLYAIAFAKLVCSNRNPSEVEFVPSTLRSHLRDSLINSNAEFKDFPFVSRGSFHSPKVSVYDKVYCYCRKKDDGKQMVECSSCFEWFHRRCLLENGINIKGIRNREFNCTRCLSYSDVIDIE
jgi:zinc finger SWIM domain-containing protein 3